MGRNKATATVTIPNGGSLSGAVNLGDKTLAGIQMPAAWIGAGLSFQASDDGGVTWQNMYDSTGAEITLAVSGLRVSVDPKPFAGIDFLKVRSGTNGTPVAQGANCVLTLISRQIYPITSLAIAASTAAVAANSAVFQSYDTVTQGNWKGVYGQDGGKIGTEAAINYPSYITTAGWVTTGGTFDYGTPTPAAASIWPQKPGGSDPTIRTGQVTYGPAQITLDLVITDGQSHTAALYELDSDNASASGDLTGRKVHIYITDLADNILDDRGTVTGMYTTPKYLIWRIRGSVRVYIVGVYYNVVQHGIFFSTP